ncbi:MAG: formylglycine-generating enzyme family protein [Nostoc desertorum CM1-VF14]|nr:formylglycine-generating enzyme family protein [Nostoc desertorum CM1-VF14]
MSYLVQFPKCSVPVGSFPAKAFGLYDMYGNISEWY